MLWSDPSSRPRPRFHETPDDVHGIEGRIHVGRKILDDDMARASGLVCLGFIFLTLLPS